MARLVGERAGERAVGESAAPLDEDDVFIHKSEPCNSCVYLPRQTEPGHSVVNGELL